MRERLTSLCLNNRAVPNSIEEVQRRNRVFVKSTLTKRGSQLAAPQIGVLFQLNDRQFAFDTISDEFDALTLFQTLEHRLINDPKNHCHGWHI